MECTTPPDSSSLALLGMTGGAPPPFNPHNNGEARRGGAAVEQGVGVAVDGVAHLAAAPERLHRRLGEGDGQRRLRDGAGGEVAGGVELLAVRREVGDEAVVMGLAGGEAVAEDGELQGAGGGDGAGGGGGEGKGEVEADGEDDGAADSEAMDGGDGDLVEVFDGGGGAAADA